MTVDEMIEVLQAYKNGKTIQVRPKLYDDKSYEDISDPSFRFGQFEYRVKPDEPDYINWDHVHSDYKFMARNINGTVFLFSVKPITTGDFWNSPGLVCRAIVFSSYKRGTVSWENSLVERPK